MPQPSIQSHRRAQTTAWPRWMVLACIAAGACANTGHEPTGRVGLALSVTPGVSVSSVHYVIHAGAPGGIADAGGDMKVDDANASPSVFRTFPPSTGDVATLTATTSNNQPCTGQSPPFDVHTGATAQVDVTLVCGGSTPTNTMGTVNIGGTVIEGDNCPLITSWSASPLQASVGSAIDLFATATDADVGVTPGEVLTFAWTSAGGSFASPAAASTQFTCTVGGQQTVTLTVSDNHAPKACAYHVDIPVLCVGGDTLGFCGDGLVGPAEDCDGLGVVVPGKGICGAACKFQQPICGNNVVEIGEECDPPDGVTCNNACKVITGPGTGIACATCEINATTAGTCFNTSTSANAGTTDFAKFGCNGFSGSALTACYDLLSCLRTTHCAAGDDPTPCLCSGLPATTCATTPLSALPGVCAPQYIAAGFGADLFGQIFFSTDSPVGVANNLYSCDVGAACNCHGSDGPPQGGTGAAGAGGSSDGQPLPR